ncbi:MAG: ABC transporter permease subunit [Candidatus Delongbacteria bacterium]|nr:ABC transporter permease subunit [Candidatus Delongbacteria bacterium]
MKTLIKIYLKDLLRNKYTTMMVILVPVLLYPMLYWGITQFLMVKSGLTDNQEINLSLDIRSEKFYSIKDSIETIHNFKITETSNEVFNKEGIYLMVDEVDSLPYYTLHLDSTNSIQKEFFAKLEVKLSDYYDLQLGGRIDASAYNKDYFNTFWVTKHNIDGEYEIMTKILSMIIPLMSIITIIAGIGTGAVELTAGHTEDKTTETTLTTSLSRKKIIMAKLLATNIYGLTAGILNFSFLTFVITQIINTLMMQFAGKSLEFDWSLIFNFKIILITFFSLAIMSHMMSLIFVAAAGFAKNRKEGNILITPFFMAFMMMSYVVIIPAIEPSLVISMVPVLNVAMMIKLLLVNDVQLIFFGETVLFSMVWMFLLYKLLLPFMLKEEIILGNSNTSLIKQIKGRFAKWKKK